MTKSITGVLCLVAGLSACAGVHSKQYQDAAQAYAQAKAADARILSSDALLEAENLLDRAAAERNGSPTEVHYGYLAECRARVAESEANRRRLASELGKLCQAAAQLQAEQQRVRKTRPARSTSLK